MNIKKEINFDNVFDVKPDLSSGSNDVYFLGDRVVKILKPSTVLYQFCADSSPDDVLLLLKRMRQLLTDVFGDMLVPTKYFIHQGKIITVQARIRGKTLKELSQTPSYTHHFETLRQGANQLRDVWSDDPELLGFIIDEILNPNNVIINGEKLVIIDWL